MPSPNKEERLWLKRILETIRLEVAKQQDTQKEQTSKPTTRMYGGKPVMSREESRQRNRDRALAHYHKNKKLKKKGQDDAQPTDPGSPGTDSVGGTEPVGWGLDIQTPS